MPACLGFNGASDPHCFHAHFLLFPGAPSITADARKHFATEDQFMDLLSALKGAREKDEYILISDRPEEVSVFTRPGKLIPQFARLLVAEAIGHSELANWRKSPRREQAKQDARELREQWKRRSDD